MVKGEGCNVNGGKPRAGRVTAKDKVIVLANVKVKVVSSWQLWVSFGPKWY